MILSLRRFVFVLALGFAIAMQWPPTLLASPLQFTLESTAAVAHASVAVATIEVRTQDVKAPDYLAAGGRAAKFETMIKEVLAWLRARRKPHVPLSDEQVTLLARTCDDVLPPGYDIELPSTQGAGGSRKAATTPEGSVRADGPHGLDGPAWHKQVHVHINNRTGDTVCFIDDWGNPTVRRGGGGH